MPLHSDPIASTSGGYSSALYTVPDKLGTLRELLSAPGACDTEVPGDIKLHIESLIEFFQVSQGKDQEQEVSEYVAEVHGPPHVLPEIRNDVKVTRKTLVEILYTYQIPNTLVEYPLTSSHGKVGHLFAIDPTSDFHPARNFVYSQGDPKGTQLFKNHRQDGKGKRPSPGIFNLLDKDGITVPYRVSHATCQGMKACPFVNQIDAHVSHISASREALSLRFKVLDSEERRKAMVPANNVFIKTLAYFSALKRHGCGSPLYETTLFTETEYLDWEEDENRRRQESRGHSGGTTCKGRLLFEYTSTGKPFIRCEHYNSQSNKDHFNDFTIASGLLDAEYLEALFFGNKQATSELEFDVSLSGIGPRAPCTTIRNFSTIKTNCSSDHRDDDGKLVNPELIHLECKSTFRVYEPLEEYRLACPWVLIVCQGAHSHPIPIPLKTPPVIVEELFRLISKTNDTLPDLTPRRFLRHPILQNYLEDRLPDIKNPMLLDVHPSLANRDHLRNYIDKVREKFYPNGTGWKGLLHLKTEQDGTSDFDSRYIRFMGEFPDHTGTGKAEEGDEAEMLDVPLRIAICMLKENSFRLLNEKYIQSDIGFKRVVGWKEFELGARDSVTRITTTYCRVYTTRQTAEAHRLIFHKIDEIVKEDTGQNLRWRHLHSYTPADTDAVGIFHLTADQHGGQAKGFGLYLCDVARDLPQKADLHEPHRYIQELDVYDHLRRIFRLCVIHFIRKIQSCAVPESVKIKMRGLICIQHPSWNVSLREIQNEGGKAAQGDGLDWVADKVRSKFAFPAICWEKSCIPQDIWRAGENNSNIIEQLHEDVNREGITCTLVGGVRKAHHFDILKSRTLHATLRTGVHPAYKNGHISNSSLRSIQRKVKIQSKVLKKQDNELTAQNEKLRKLHNEKQAAITQHQLASTGLNSELQTRKAAEKKDRMDQAYEKALATSLSHIGKGSGKVGLLLPPGAVPSTSTRPQRLETQETHSPTKYS